MPVYQTLVKLSVYEITAFNRVFKTIEDEGLGNNEWIEALQNSIYNCDAAAYRKLIQLIVD
jgi:hypothetical protein